MQATMIRIERNAKMEQAIQRCRKSHPKVRRIDSNTVSVTTTNGSYRVTILTPREDLLLANCTCQAGLRGQLCLHVPAAMAAPVAPVSTPAPHKLAGVLVKGLGNVVTIDGWTV